MLAELSEQDATGELAVIYREIREFCAVPYVSSLQRHLATRPGWLEWGWQCVRPVFASGIAQEAAWHATAVVEARALPAVAPAVANLWGVDATQRRIVRDIAELFVRVSPTNLMFSAMVRFLLAGRDARGTKTLPRWRPPEAIPEPPGMVAFEDLNGDAYAALMRFGTEVAGQPFVPGLYRMMAHWPGFLGYLNTTLAPRLHDEESAAACMTVQRRVDEAAEHVFQQLPPPDGSWPMPPVAEHEDVLDAVERYRVTSPQMIVFGTLIKNCLREDTQ
tara:strand:- start:30 stop:857 length:828 start_codon:yes stop_codon:yes gene_type:complete